MAIAAAKCANAAFSLEDTRLWNMQYQGVNCTGCWSFRDIWTVNMYIYIYIFTADELCFGIANGRVLNFSNILANILISEEKIPYETDLWINAEGLTLAFYVNLHIYLLLHHTCKCILHNLHYSAKISNFSFYQVPIIAGWTEAILLLS